MRIADYNLRAFVVTLQEMPEKEQFIQEHFKSVGVEAECFNGVSASASGFRTAYPYEVDAPGSGWKIGAKSVATWISFYTLYAACNLLPDSHFWFLEWDCEFPANWRARLEAALKDAPPDFDMLFVGSCCTEGKPKTPVCGELWDVHYPQCGHSLIVAKKAIPVVLRTQRKCYAPWDISLALNTLPHLKCLTILPRICSQFGTLISE